jgi:hypothetical protein
MHASHGALAMHKRLIKELKKAYPEVLILFRTDPCRFRALSLSGATEDPVRYRVHHQQPGVGRGRPAPFKGARQYKETAEKQLLFTSFSY